MKKTFIGLSALAMLCAGLFFAHAAETVTVDAVSITTPVTAGEYVVTNTTTDPYILKSVVATVPSATTNELQIVIERDLETTLWYTENVVTNPFGNIETNYYHQPTNTTIVTITQSLVRATSVNELNVGLQAGTDFLDDVLILPNDRTRLTTTLTNTFYAIFNMKRVD